MSGWYIKIRYKEKLEGRKIWYFDSHLSLIDDVQSLFPFDNKQRAIDWAEHIGYKYSNKVKAVSVHYRREK